MNFLLIGYCVLINFRASCNSKETNFLYLSPEKPKLLRLDQQKDKKVSNEVFTSIYNMIWKYQHWSVYKYENTQFANYKIEVVLWCHKTWYIDFQYLAISNFLSIFQTQYHRFQHHNLYWYIYLAFET